MSTDTEEARKMRCPVHAMVEVFAEVRRVLRSDGTLWLNIGDWLSMATKGLSAWSP
jgi:hypothetical protein